ncbi:hypothetical protein [Halopenitus malekzadehii]|uniref:hypothetical protein n=1 Tax=Halopenitus malekzadehii TaxID=1267564 RepID=UPI000B8815D9|nr:hypothetical protein [Halopenitus malekzadehii]
MSRSRAVTRYRSFVDPILQRFSACRLDDRSDVEGERTRGRRVPARFIGDDGTAAGVVIHEESDPFLDPLP